VRNGCHEIAQRLLCALSRNANVTALGTCVHFEVLNDSLARLVLMKLNAHGALSRRAVGQQQVRDVPRSKPQASRHLIARSSPQQTAVNTRAAIPRPSRACTH
jgi:hypothetical protein